MTDYTKYLEKILHKLPENIAEEIRRVESDISKQNEKIALFDFDGTLIYGDIGESIFTFLKANGHNIDFRWSEYLALVNNNELKKAYVQMVTSMKGINLNTVRNAARHLIKSSSSEIFFSEDGKNYTYPLPKSVSGMINIIYYLKLSGWKISVISASYHYAVREVCNELFKLSNEYIRGIKTELYVTDNYEDIITENVLQPIPVLKGKADVYKEMFANAKPLITAGNTTADKYLLELTADSGIAIISGMKNSERELVKKSIDKNIKTVDFRMEDYIKRN